MTILKDKNIRLLEDVLLLSDGTPVAEYTKFDDKQKYVLIGDKEFGPFEGVELFLPFTKNPWVNVENYYFVARKFDKKVVCFTKEKELPKIARENQNREFSAASKEALDYFSNLLDKEAKEESKIDVDALIEELTASIKDFENPYIKQKGKYYYFEINDQSFGPFSYIWGYDVNDKEHFQLAYVSPFNEMMLNYMLDGKYVTSVQLEKPLEDNTPFLPYFSFMDSVRYTKSGKAVFSNIPDSCIYIDGKRVDYFGGECSDIVYFEEAGHFLASGHPAKKSSGHWYYGDKAISLPVNAGGLEFSIEFEDSLIYYLRDGIRYVLMNGKEYQGFRVNKNFVAILVGDEITLYPYKNKVSYRMALAEYLAENNLIAGAQPLAE